MRQHTSENRATIEELKQEMVVNSILTDLVRTEADQYVDRMEVLEKQVHKFCRAHLLMSFEILWFHLYLRALNFVVLLLQTVS